MVSAEAEREKERGNNLLKDGKLDDAIDAYSKAIEIDGSNHIYYSNRSHAYAKTENFPSALADANRCVELKPDWAKGYNRLSAAFRGLGDQAKADDAMKKFRDLGGAPVAASGTSSSGGSAASAQLPDVLSKMQLGLRVFLVLNFMLYAFPLTSSSGAFQRTLFAAFGTYLIHIYRVHGKPERTREYAQRLALDYRSHYAMSALLFAFAGSPRMIVLLPHLLSEIGYVADYILTAQPQIAAKISPTMNSMVLPKFTQTTPDQWAQMDLRTKWQRYNQVSMQYSSGLEVAIGISLIFEMLLPTRNFLALFAYWHFLRVRYMCSENVKLVFRNFDTQIMSYASRNATAMNLYQKVRDFASAMVQPNQQPQGGGMSGLMSRCTIS
mmetsp:Transcript_895/g.2074  ORF Transcript_895/g.2074 Transcript_895/m.2074 type:complete len:382 (+) Transcript_895:352-1497(+)|eukprot:CAMPEP_0171527268 /NCGR_PEP_ID=MMETSP0959-20130129/10948_1 /TAXON_ID=87120 /ORGANISM="Aurantiochytrium limacinum, Strain ATCCMYA-1381" /LENGTH=381 /DNA_ID=CAMNT_0012068971 /DNA_START=322 /DNA_END=1467 /DNA_ORIENTATION=+